MGRPPCCDKAGIKKGPWTPEEDIVLVSYIQDHGPGNWKLVPTNSGLMRCSKSCRLRWTNYLRPGIKRGNFNSHEEEIIIQLQALIGNRWAAIASYLPQRTDNDIKNYWNTHLKKKKMKKHQAAMSGHIASSDSAGSTSHDIVLGGCRVDEIRNHSPSPYASSAENISRLLEDWMRSSPNQTLSDENLQHRTEKESFTVTNNSFIMNQIYIDVEINSQLLLKDSATAWNETSTDSVYEPPMSMLEKWLLEENAGQMDALLDLSAADCSSEIMLL